MLDSNPNKLLYQVRPKKRFRAPHFQEDGWHTTDGSLYESNKTAQCIDWCRHHYFRSEFTHFVTINVAQDIDPKDMKTLWSKTCALLCRHRVVAIWVVEVSRRSNHFNYHLLVRTASGNIYDLIKKAFGPVKSIVQVQDWDTGKGKLAARYVFKAKTRQGTNPDRWKRKRVLFRKELKIRRYGTIGQFWPEGKNKEDLWAEIISKERKIKDGLSQCGAEEHADDLYAYFDGTVERKKLARLVGYFADQSWTDPTRWTFPDVSTRNNRAEQLVHRGSRHPVITGNLGDSDTATGQLLRLGRTQGKPLPTRCLEPRHLLQLNPVLPQFVESVVQTPKGMGRFFPRNGHIFGDVFHQLE